MIAVISDVHANLEALQAVLADIGESTDVYCTGDVVGYGPDPNACCELLRERGARCTMGNHDYTCATLQDMEPCNPLARESFLWTHGQLTEENREWLLSLPLQLSVDGSSMVHGSPGTRREMLNAYVLRSSFSGERCSELLKRVRAKRLIVGHTHVPMRYGFNDRIVNPGSVGQPRDGDWRASYVTIEDMDYRFAFVLDPRASFSRVRDKVVFHRVEYDCGTTVKKIERQDGLPAHLSHILQHGGLRF